MRDNKAIRSAGLWQFFEVSGLALIQLLYFSLMARILTKDDYGSMAIASAIAGIGAIFINGGIGTALIQKKSISASHISAAMQISFSMGVVVCLVIFLGAPLMEDFYQVGGLEDIVKVLSINVLLLSVANILVNLMHKNFMFKECARVTLASHFAGYLGGGVLALMGWGVWSLVYATIIASFLKVVGYFYVFPVKVFSRFRKRDALDVLGFGSGMILLQAANYIATNGLSLFLARVFTPGMLGVFERAMYLNGLPSQMLGNVIDKVTFPVMAEVQDEDDKVIGAYVYSLGLAFSLILPITAFLIIFCEEIVAIIMGEKWASVVLPLKVLFVVMPIALSGRITDSVIRAKGLIYKNVSRKYVYAVLVVCSATSLGYYYGLVGAAIGVLLSGVVNYLMMLRLVGRIFPGRIRGIFWHPLLVGFGIAISVCVLSVMSMLLFGGWGEVSISGLILSAVFMTALACLVAMLKPAWTGCYIEALVLSMKEGSNGRLH